MVINCTKNDVAIYTGCKMGADGRYRGGEVIAVIPRSGKQFSSHDKEHVLDGVEIDGVTVPLSYRERTSVDQIPEDDNLYLVPYQYVVSCWHTGVDTSRLLTVGKSVFDEYGHICGCIGLVQN